MHRALYIQEILINIFVHCPHFKRSGYLEHRFYRSTGGLAVLVRICQTFKEPALDVLWSELNDFDPLLRCIPEACEYVNYKPYAWNRPLSEAEWATVRGYARRVRSIDAIPKSCYHRSAYFFSSLSLPASLFPNLQSVTWPETSLPTTHFTVPSLKSIEIKVSSRDISNVDFFVTAGRLCPNVAHVEFYFVGLHDEVPNEVISRLICCWKKLRKVYCRNVMLSTDAIVHLSRVPTLTKLWITLGEIESRLPNLIGLSVSAFSRLKHLKFSTRWLESATKLLSVIRLPEIVRLYVKYECYASRSEIGAYVDVVRNTCSVHTLAHFGLTDSFDRRISRYRTLRRRQSQSDDSDEDDIQSDSESIIEEVLPLRAFVNLCSITVGWNHKFEWSEGSDLVNKKFVEVAAEVWPRMDKLVVGETSYRERIRY